MTLHKTANSETSHGGPLETISAGTMGVLLFLAALTMLFGATIAGYLFVRSQAEAWPPPGSPPLPAGGLWLSTGIILLASGTMHWALRSIRWEREKRMRVGLVLTMVLGGLFLVSQAHNWEQLRQILVVPGSQAQTFTAVFYMLTGTHALHVIGGLVLLGIVTYKAFRGAYSSAYHGGIRYTAMYWHFLDVVWLILFVLILFV